ncbi:MAG: hypothetical protein LBR25_08325 [Erysipelotrichaceae bacterium]|jgi:amino acid transporter|nr:hypothetical protein [Erysipelotrichaceae bacterium]
MPRSKVKTAVLWFEPLIFIYFGIFLGSRIWAFFDRESYAAFFLGLLLNKSLLYFVLMALMFLLCLAGLSVFFLQYKQRSWWRWLYFFGGAYVLFDCTAILCGFGFWQQLLFWMFDTANPYWNLIWGFFTLLGLLALLLGFYLLHLLLPPKKMFS